MPATNVTEVFEQIFPQRIKNKPDLVTKINATYKFVVNGEQGGTWIVDLTSTGGHVKAGDGEARCTIKMNEKEFLDLVNGKLNPQMAFMTGKLKVEGEMGLALKLSSLIG